MNSNTIKSAARVLDLLELLGASPTPLGVSEVARRLVIPKSSTSGLLTTLVARGYASRDEDGRYTLNRTLAGRWSGPDLPHLVALARPVMQALVERTGETSYLGVLTPAWQVQYVEKVVSPQDVRYDSDIAAPRAPYNISTGQVLLAFRPPREVASVLARAIKDAAVRRVIGSIQGFERDLGRVRATGYATNVDTRVVGASGVAAPILGPDGSAAAALNVTAPTVRFEGVRARMIEGVVPAAKDISARYALGWPASRGTAPRAVGKR